MKLNRSPATREFDMGTVTLPLTHGAKKARKIGGIFCDGAAAVRQFPAKSL